VGFNPRRGHLNRHPIAGLSRWPNVSWHEFCWHPSAPRALVGDPDGAIMRVDPRSAFATEGSPAWTWSFTSPVLPRSAWRSSSCSDT